MDKIEPNRQIELDPSFYRKLEQSMINTEKAILKHPDEYLKIKSIVNQVIKHPVDIDEYYTIAVRLATLLESMGRDTIFFPYFLNNVDPRNNCQARYFRYICMDLDDQIKNLNHWRRKRLKIRVI